MRCCYCLGTLLQVQGEYAVEARDLQIPMMLRFDEGTPDLSARVGQSIRVSGNLEAVGTNQEVLNLVVTDIAVPSSPDAAITPVFGVFSGNIGKAAELSPNANNGLQRLTSSIAYHSENQKTSWLRLSCLSNEAIYGEFSELEAGSRIIAFGTMSHYNYNKKSRLELVLMTFDKEAGSSYKPPEKLYTASSASGASPEPIPGF